MTDENRHRQPWMSDDQWECHRLLADLFRGFHHVEPRRIKPSAEGISYRHSTCLATFDGDDLTRLVIMCHERCIRGSVEGAGLQGQVKIRLHRRHQREGSMMRRHPTMDTVLGIET